MRILLILLKNVQLPSILPSCRVGRYSKPSAAHSPLKLLHEAHDVEDKLEVLYSVVGGEPSLQHAVAVDLALCTTLNGILGLHQPAAH